MLAFLKLTKAQKRSCRTRTLSTSPHLWVGPGVGGEKSRKCSYNRTRAEGIGVVNNGPFTRSERFNVLYTYIFCLYNRTGAERAGIATPTEGRKELPTAYRQGLKVEPTF